MADAANTPLEVLTMGRIGVDLYPLQTGVRLEDVTSFGKSLGGSATNVAVAAARHGHAAGVITRVGDDPFGRYLTREVARLGADARHIRSVEDIPTPVTFCEIFPPDDFPLYFYRLPIAPDLLIRAEELDLSAVAAASVFWITATGLSREPSRAAHDAALAARAGAKGWTVLDLDYRAGFWESRDEASAAVAEVLPRVDVAVGNLEECAVAVGTSDPEAAALALLDRGVRLAIVKQGPDGVLAMTAEERVVVPPVPVEVVNGLGAGDAFGGAVIHGLLSGWDLPRTLRFANAAGAIVAGRRECAAAMPTPAEVETFIGGAA